MSHIKVNGKSVQTAHTTVQLLLDELELSQGRYAVEVNGEMIPKSELHHTKIFEGMIIEVVRAVGGG